MRKLFILILLILPLTLMATEYSVSIMKDGSMYRILGTNYYLDITGCYEYGVVDAILNTATSFIKVKKSFPYGNQKYDSYYFRAYEKIDLPPGTVNENGLFIWSVYVPTTII